ncbi:ABC transporter permease [Bdellovibrio reynosensis]|uniref:Transport permease protein n=1 Tax=Bdellovibrio reynosensis TaxID=2835041 RepID=A0ABY4CAB9_9BACT|nr:ABC transporter permease [Bdellovibrio reynosensis]UOF01911.1 ABC transporter permease [Bdellovibrio reynosensis]
MTGFVTVFRREIARFMKVIVQTVITPFVSSFLYLLIFGVSLGGQMPSHQGVSYLAFLIPGLMMMGLINNSFQNSSSSIVSSKFSGDLEDLRVAPVTDHEIIWAMSLGAVVRGSIVSVITYLVGSFFMLYQKGEWLMVAHPLTTVFFLIVAGLIFGMIGISIAFWAKTFDQLSAFSAFILLPLTYLGGVFLSIENLHPFWQAVSKLNPLLYLINGLRYGILGVSDVNVWTAAVISLLGFVFFYVTARFSLKKGSFQRW